MNFRELLDSVYLSLAGDAFGVSASAFGHVLNGRGLELLRLLD